MSVRLRKWTTKEGKVLERWTIDVKVALPGQRPRRIRDFSPVNTRRGAELYERQVREALLAGTLGKEVKEVPTLEAFQARFLDYSEVNNKPSTVSKRWVLRVHLVPAFVMRGVALKAVQELLGHATIDMTMRYAHLSPDVKRDAVQLLDDVPPRVPSPPAVVGGEGELRSP